MARQNDKDALAQTNKSKVAPLKLSRDTELALRKQAKPVVDVTRKKSNIALHREDFTKRTVSADTLYNLK